MKAGALAAGTVITGAALVGVTPVAPFHGATAGLFGPAQRDVVLTANAAADLTPANDFDGALINLLNMAKLSDGTGLANATLPAVINFADGNFTVNNLLALIPTGTASDGTANPTLTASSDVSALLAALNPGGTSLNAITGGILGDTIDTDLGSVGKDTLDQLVGQLIGSKDVDTTTIGQLFDALHIGPSDGASNLSGFLSIIPNADACALGICANLNDNDTVHDLLSSLLSMLLGKNATGADMSADTLNTLLGDVTVGKTDLGDTTIASLLGISTDQLNAGWDKYLDGLDIGGSLLNPSNTTLGGESIANVLNMFLPAGTTAITGDDTWGTFAGDLLGTPLSTEPLDELLGLATVAASP